MTALSHSFKPGNPKRQKLEEVKRNKDRNNKESNVRKKNVKLQTKSQDALEGEDIRNVNANIAVEAVQEIYISTTGSKKRKIEVKELEPRTNQETTPKKKRKSELEQLEKEVQEK